MWRLLACCRHFAIWLKTRCDPAATPSSFQRPHWGSSSSSRRPRGTCRGTLLRPAYALSVASVSARPDRATACASTTTIRSRPSSSSRPVVAGGVSRSGAPIGPRVYRARREDGHPPAGHATCASVATKRSRVTSCLLEALPRGDWDLAGPRTNSSTCKHFRSACCLFSSSA